MPRTIPKRGYRLFMGLRHAIYPLVGFRSWTQNVRRAVQYVPLSTPEHCAIRSTFPSLESSHMHLNCYQNAYSEDRYPCNTNLLHCSVRTPNDPAATLALPNYSTRPGGDSLNGTERLRGTQRTEDIQTGRCVLSGTSLHSLPVLWAMWSAASTSTFKHGSFVLQSQLLSAFLYTA